MEDRRTVEMDEPEGTAGEPALYAKEFFDVPRHELITGVAVRLFSPNTAARIQQLLDPIGAVFDDIGGWADNIKRLQTRPDDPETVSFFEDPRNRSHHKTWHYVNLPLGAADYAQAAQSGFTRDDDVVQTIKECVRVLQGASDRFSKVNALRLIGHLVGDVHQPLHVGCGFIDEREDPPKFVGDPEIIRQNNFESDAGGNAIALPGAGHLHSYWDGGLGGLINSIDLNGPEADAEHAADSPLDEASHAGLKARLIEQLYQDIISEASDTPADAEADETPAVELAEQWANESLVVARDAYRTFKITERIEKAKPSGQVEVTYKISWEGKTSYNARCAPFLRKQMTSAVRHLAKLLNLIFD